MKRILTVALSAVLSIFLSACGGKTESTQPNAEMHSEQPVSAQQNPVKDYMESNFDGEYDVILTDTRTEVRVYGLSKEDTQSLAISLRDLAETVSVSDYSTENSTILYTYQNGELAYDANDTEKYELRGDGTVTMEIYRKIKIGMTYNEVVNLIGADGTPLLSAGEGEYGFESYDWPGANSEYSSASITFQDGVVSAKIQIGLDQDWE